MVEVNGKSRERFEDHAAISQRLKTTMRDTPNWGGLSSDKKEALEMIARKIARILNGDPDYADTWLAISGYVTLVEQRLVAKEPSQPSPQIQMTLDLDDPNVTVV